MLQYRKQSGAVAVRANDVRLHRVAVPHLRHVLHVYRSVVDCLDRQIVQGRDQLGAAVELNQVFASSYLRGPGGKDQVLKAECIRYVCRREPLSVKRVGIDIDHHAPHLASVGQRHGDALHGRKARADEVVPIVEQFLLGESTAAQPQL